MDLVRALLLLVALVSPALAQSNDGAALAGRASDAAKELRTYFTDVAKAGGRPDFSKPPASELFGHIFDMSGLAGLPPPAPNEFSWLLTWSAAGSAVIRDILTFGITPPVGPKDQAAIERNLVDYEDQQAVASGFLVRITARESTSPSIALLRMLRMVIRSIGLAFTSSAFVPGSATTRMRSFVRLAPLNSSSRAWATSTALAFLRRMT